jgi:hypothetical protein
MASLNKVQLTIPVATRKVAALKRRHRYLEPRDIRELELARERRSPPADEWHRLIIFSERLGETALRYLRKGSKLYVEGSLRTRNGQDQSGQDRCIARTTGRPAGLHDVVRSLSQAPVRLPGSLRCRPANIP